MATAGEDDWELVNDDGFVYRRRKRQRLEPVVTGYLEPDPEMERRNRLQRRKNLLHKLRDMYQNEISHWDLLSNILNEMEESARAQSKELHFSTEYGCFSALQQQHTPDRSHRSIIDELFIQVETQEAIIKDVSKLCDLAEALCNAHDERKRQQLVNLPIWDPSPQELLTVLGKP